MPTVIDELIVRLSLDSSQFDEGDQRLVSSLRRMEAGALSSGRRIEESASNSTLQFFRTIESPYASMRKMFEKLATTVEQPNRQLRNLEDQGRRTGESVESGALAGARGLRVLGAAGLGVFAAYEGLSKMINSANANAQRLFGSGIGAAAAGMGINQFTAISQALYRTGNVPQEQTQATLAGWRSAQIGLTHGDQASAQMLTSLTTALAQRGISGINVFQDSPEEIMNKLSAAFAGMSAEDAQSAGVALNLSQEQVYGMRAAGGNLPNLTEQERARAATESQAHGAGDLVKATNNLTNAFDHLGRVMLDLESGPLSKLENALAGMIDRLAGLGESGAASGYSEEGYSWWQRNMPGFLGGNTKSGNPWSLSSPWSDWGFGGTSNGLRRSGGGSGGGGVGAGSGSVPTTGGGADLLRGLGITPSDPEWEIAMRESRGRPNVGWSGLPGSPEYSPGGTDLSGVPLDSTGFPMWKGKMGPAGNSTAAGLFMITATNWHNIAPGLGIHDFSPESQLRVQQELVRRAHGYSDWAASGRTNFAYNPNRVFTPPAGGTSLVGGAGPLAFGDSIAVGLADTGLSEPYIKGYRTTAAQRADTSQFAVSGRTTSEVLALLRANAGNLGGRRVLLSSGASNDVGEAGGPVNYDAIAQQLEVLKNAHANAVLLGVGAGLKRSKEVNQRLAALAAKYGIPFGGELLTSEGVVHPHDYGANLSADLALLQKDQVGGVGGSVTHNAGDVNVNGDIVVHAPTREGYAIGGAVADRISRVGIATAANSGLTQ